MEQWHSLALSTWGNPTERSTQGASTDEAYWLANDYQYNPYWGYQNGHKRNSRVVKRLRSFCYPHLGIGDINKKDEVDNKSFCSVFYV